MDVFLVAALAVSIGALCISVLNYLRAKRERGLARAIERAEKEMEAFVRASAEATRDVHGNRQSVAAAFISDAPNWVQTSRFEHVILLEWDRAHAIRTFEEAAHYGAISRADADWVEVVEDEIVRFKAGSSIKGRVHPSDDLVIEALFGKGSSFVRPMTA